MSYKIQFHQTLKEVFCLSTKPVAHSGVFVRFHSNVSNFLDTIVINVIPDLSTFAKICNNSAISGEEQIFIHYTANANVCAVGRRIFKLHDGCNDTGHVLLIMCCCRHGELVIFFVNSAKNSRGVNIEVHHRNWTANQRHCKTKVVYPFCWLFHIVTLHSFKLVPHSLTEISIATLILILCKIHAFQFFIRWLNPFLKMRFKLLLKLRNGINWFQARSKI